uniref:Stress regulated protein n=1 Tax=Tetraselmis sp. GSL018 TaxID=582737 RepID=A0A061RPP9_9CHLO
MPSYRSLPSTANTYLYSRFVSEIERMAPRASISRFRYAPSVPNNNLQMRRNRLRTRAATTETDKINHQASLNIEKALEYLDEYLKPLEGKPGVADENSAVALMEALTEAGTSRGFGGARQVPKKSYSLEELRINKIRPERLLSPEDKTLNKISDRLSLALAAGIGALAYGEHWSLSQFIGAAAAVAFGVVADQVAARGGVGALLLDTAGRTLSAEYRDRVSAHEAGHFLIAYLVGILPQAYTLSALEAFRRYGAFNVQAGTLFCDSAFQKEIASGRLSSGSLDKYTCVALAGVATEYLQFGVAEGGIGDVQQLDGLLKALKFTQAKADDEIRWAVLNTVTLLRRHEDIHRKLAEAMLRGASVGEGILIIERGLAAPED